MKNNIIVSTKENTSAFSFSNLCLFSILLLIILSPARFFSNGFFIWNIPSISYAGSAFSIFTLSIIMVSIIFFFAWYHFKGESLIVRPGSDILFFFIYLSLTGILLHTLLVCYFRSCSIELIGSNLSTVFSIFAALFFFVFLSFKYASYALLSSLILVCLLAPFLNQYMSYADIGRGGSLGFSPNELGVIGFALVCHGVLMSLAKQTYRHKRGNSLEKYFIYISIVAGLIGVLQSGSRRALLLSLIVFIVLPLLKGKFSFLLKVFLITSIFAIFVFYYFQDFIILIPSLNRVLGFESGLDYMQDLGRINIWHMGSSSLPDGFLGYGSIGMTANLVYHNFTLHSHNLFLQLLLQYGPFLGSIIMASIVTASYKAFQNCKNYNNELFSIFNVSSVLVVSFFLFGLLDWFFYNPKSVFIFTLALLLSLGGRRAIYG